MRLEPLLIIRLALLLVLSACLGVAVAGESIQLAVLMPVPNPRPVEPARARPAPPVDEPHPARRSIELNPIYDATNPAFSKLQRMDEATRDLKRDELGFPDWMASLRSGAIAPRANLSGTEKMTVLDLDVVMKNTRDMPYVLFPHQAHTLWLDCSNCHPAPFLPKNGANPVSMGAIFKGNYCGMCHDRVAFITFFSCNRCHRVAHDGAPSRP